MRICNFLALLIAFMVSPIAYADETGSIAIHVVGLRNNNGVVRIAVFNNAKDYAADKPKADLATVKAIANIKDGTADYTFSKLPYGEYAIKIFHDEDNSGKFYTNFLGIPRVEFGFSNNAHGRFGPAHYDQAKFKLASEELKMTINMQHI